MLCDDGKTVVIKILEDIKNGYMIVPGEVSLGSLSKCTGISPQNIGMAYDPYITKPLAVHGYKSTKSGKPVRINVWVEGS